MLRTLRGLPLLGCLLGSIGCQGQSPAPPPIPKGDYSAIIRYLQTRIPRDMAQANVPGLSIALVNGQELIWTRGFGMADKTKGLPVTPNTAFRAGAISKLLTASAALQLVEQQRLALDAPIQQTLREFYVRSRFHTDRRPPTATSPCVACSAISPACPVNTYVTCATTTPWGRCQCACPASG